MVKTQISVLIFLLSVSQSIAQNVWIARNLTNTPFELLMHKDSIPDLHKIEEGVVFMENDTLILMDRYKDYSSTYLFISDELTEGHLESYLYSMHLYETGLLVSLDFVNKRLYRIGIYSDRSYHISNFKYEVDRHFKKSGRENYTSSIDSTVYKDRTIVKYGQRVSEYSKYVKKRGVGYNFHENLKDGYGSLILTDIRISRRLPFLCSRSTERQRSWSRIEKYLTRKRYR